MSTIFPANFLNSQHHSYSLVHVYDLSTANFKNFATKDWENQGKAMDNNTFFFFFCDAVTGLLRVSFYAVDSLYVGG